MNNSPWIVNCAATSLYGLKRKRMRFGGAFDKFYVEFKQRETWSYTDLVAFQEEKLEKLIQHVYHSIPHYRRVMDEVGLNPSDITCLDDLKKLPIITKEEVRQDSTVFFSDKAKRKSLIHIKTGGSTGVPLSIFLSPEQEQIQHAFLWSRFRRHVTPSDRNALFTGRNLHLPVHRKRPPHWVDNWSDRQRLFTVFKLGQETFQDYVNALNDHQPVFITGYQSAWSILSRFMLDANVKLSCQITDYYSSSEQLLPENKAVIEAALGCRVWNHYGLNERVGAITEYDCGHLHYDMDYSILEFLPVGRIDGLDLMRVIGTTMYNFDWPLIRYDTGDLVLMDAENSMGCPTNSSPIIHQVFGRTGSFLETPDGRRVCNITTISRNCTNFSQIQAVQEDQHSVTIRVIPEVHFSSKDARQIETEFQKKLGNEMNINVVTDEELAKTRSGKTPGIVNHYSAGSQSEIEEHQYQ